MEEDATDFKGIASSFVRETSALYRASSTTERSYYPWIRDLWARLLDSRSLPFEVRAETSERREGEGGADQPDLALFDEGDFIAVLGEVKNPEVEIADMAASTDRNNQVGRYLARTGVVLLSNVRSVGLLACKSDYKRLRGIPVPPEARDLLDVVNLWPAESAFAKGIAILPDALQDLGDLLERAVTEFAPIAEPASLARILARQARKAKADLPERFDAVAGLLDDYKTALGLSFEVKDERGSEFFRSSLIQTAYYGLFAGWTLWHRAKDGTSFEWDRMDRYLRIPFLGKLFYEFKHPDRLAELRLAPHLDRATATLARVDRPTFFSRFPYPTLRAESEGGTTTISALTYFYEPFLEAFDPELRKELGVWYTPPEIVRYQVRKVEQILRERLDCRRGFADERVVVLDPCCGTGAYLLEVVRCIATEARRRGDEATLAAELMQAVAQRIIGFEILTAPFVIAQLQLYLLLSDAGANPDRHQRPAVFLTNALTGWDDPAQIKVNFPELREEHELAQKVKRGAKIIVVLGNPPYNRFAGTALDEEADLVDHYKGISRTKDKSGKLKQVGESLLYTRWGIRKQLLDDLYIRFFRLAEKRIGEKAEYGVVSFISNSSYLTGRSHPLMRESLLKNFHEIWIDNTHGNRIASERTPWGESCETLFSFDGGAGIKVGTCITTLMKRSRASTPPGDVPLHFRDFWGRADAKRRALLDSLQMNRWDAARKVEAAKRPEGPREYETFQVTEAARWMFAPRDTNVGYEAWPALDELFPTAYQGVNPNRGLDGSVVDTERHALEDRMARYFGARSFAAAAASAPELAVPRAGYKPEQVWKTIQAKSGFEPAKVAKYLLFPLDQRWLYYETEDHLLNRPRPEFSANLAGNEFLITVPQPRRVSEARPLLARTLVDLHVHDRGSVCLPREVRAGPLVSVPNANLSPSVWKGLALAWDLSGDLSAEAARTLVARLFRCALAILHSPQYQQDHQDALAQDWAHLPIPREATLLDQLVQAGDKVAVLLEPSEDPEPVAAGIVGADRLRKLGDLRRRDGGAVEVDDLLVTASYYGAAKGDWRRRVFTEDEGALSSWGSETGDLHINAEICFANVPAAVWGLELGGYPVLKKWLGYRQASRQGGRPLTLAEARYFRSMVQRLAALLALQPNLDTLYEAVSGAAFTAEELGLRT